MPWTERQHALLAEMGLRQWSAPVGSTPLGGSHVPDVQHVQSAQDVPGQPAVAEAPGASAARAAPDAPGARGAAKPTPHQAPAVTPRPAPFGTPPTPAPIAGLDWPALRAAVAACQACGLCASRTQTVFGSGHNAAHWMVVGEAPGEQEDRQGQPFVGPSGALLDRMLAALHLTRAADGPEPPAQRVYIANTLKCRPPRNRNPTPQEMAQCEPYLVRQIELLQPRLILAMGRFAVQALLRTDEPIGKLRGRVHRYQGVPLVVTYHPAYLLRNPPDKARAWEDLCLAASVAEAEPEPEPEPEREPEPEPEPEAGIDPVALRPPAS